ncbi:hypothetical protein ACF0H5_005843 [Mactra antiquata]
MSDLVKLGMDYENSRNSTKEQEGDHGVDCSGKMVPDDCKLMACGADYKVSDVLDQTGSYLNDEKGVLPCDKIEPCSDILMNKENIQSACIEMSVFNTASTYSIDFSDPSHVVDGAHKVVFDERIMLNDSEQMSCGTACKFSEIADHTDSCLDCANEMKLSYENSLSVIKTHSDVNKDVNENHPPCSFVLPDFNQLCDNEEDNEEELSCDGLSFTCASNTTDQFLLPQLPKFESNSIQPKIDLLSNPVSNTFEAVAPLPRPEKSLTELVKEIQKDLTIVDLCDNSELDLGLESLFEEMAIEPKKESENSKSRSAKKRKKQQMKLRKLISPNALDKRKPKFAQTFDELKKSVVNLDDIDVDTTLTCSICLELYHLPNTCQPCGHMFCDLCLRRLTHQGSEGIPCPLCRTIISYCQLNKEFDENLLTFYPDIYKARAMNDRHSKYRHQKLPYTSQPCKKKAKKRIRVQREQQVQRNNQSNSRWMPHDSFKFFIGCTVAMFIGSLFMLYHRLKSVNNNRDFNIVPLSVLLGSTVTYFAFKLGQRADGRPF